MKSKFKVLGITAFVTVIVVLTAGCILEEGVKLDIHGGKSMSNAYQLKQGEYVFGHFPSGGIDSRWFSVPVVNGNIIYIWIYDYGDYTYRANAVYDLYNEAGTKFSGGPRGGTWDDFSFEPKTTGKLFIEVTSRNNGTFAIIYTNNSSKPPKPKVFD